MGGILTHYICPECSIAGLVEKSGEAALRLIVHMMTERGFVKDEKGLFAKLMERENIQSTAVGNGAAVPHCFFDEIPDLIVIVARSIAGLEFHSLDGKPTHVIFLIVGNPKEHNLFLKALTPIARLIKRTAFIEKIVSSTSVQEIVRAIDEEEAK